MYLFLICYEIISLNPTHSFKEYNHIAIDNISEKTQASKIGTTEGEYEAVFY